MTCSMTLVLHSCEQGKKSAFEYDLRSTADELPRIRFRNLDFDVSAGQNGLDTS